MRKLLIFIILFILYLPSLGQELSPVEIAGKYFGKDTTGLVDYLTGEILKRYMENKEKELTEEEKQELDSLKKMIGKVEFIDPSVNAEIIEMDSESAVVSVNISENGASEDHYLYFINSNGWKLEAHRALAMSGLQIMAIKEWEKMTPEKKEEYATHGGDLGKIEFFIETSKLLLKDDRSIIDHFIDNADRFDSFLREAKYRIMPEDFNLDEPRELPYIIEYYKKALLITNVSKEYNRAGGIYPNVIFFTIGGILDDTGGYLYVEDNKDLPKIEKSKFIMIREIGNGWYFFKTT